jgi:two-component system chemotaxis sensor kinase CheA
VVVEHNDLRLDRQRWRGLWVSLVHVVRNAVDHGFGALRGDGDPARRRVLTLRTSASEGTLAIEVHDNGAGIDWEALEAKALARGLPARTRTDLVDALFADGVTTRNAATQVSGRGVGLAAVRTACHERGGRVAVQSLPGGGTTFRFELPLRADSETACLAA